MSCTRDYLQALFKIWTRSTINPRIGEGSNLEKLFTGIAEEAERLDCEADDVLNELMPDSIGRFLEDWERVLGLPKCGIQLETRGERRDMVIAMLNLGEFQNEEFFVRLAEIFGFEVTVASQRAFRAGSSSAGDPLNSEVQENTILITAECVDKYYFRAGENVAGDRLVNCGNDGLECIINTFKHSWQYVVFRYI